MWGQILQTLAVESKTPVEDFIAASEVFPFEHENRRVILEWIYNFPVEPQVALRGLDYVVSRDPWAFDSLLTRMAVEISLDMPDAVLRDWHTLEAIGAQSTVVKDFRASLIEAARRPALASDRSPSPPSLPTQPRREGDE
jgi:hypothetical protein